MNLPGIELQEKSDRHRKKHGWKTAFHADLGQNATVTICHSRIKDLADRCREAEISLAAIGRAKHITADMIAEGAVVANIGINVLEDGTLCGDVDYENVREKVSICHRFRRSRKRLKTSVLASHVLRAARTGRKTNTRTTQRVTPASLSNTIQMGEEQLQPVTQSAQEEKNL